MRELRLRSRSGSGLLGIMAIGLVAMTSAASCGAERSGFDGNGGRDGGNPGDPGRLGEADAEPGCTNLKCRQHDCDGGTPTTLTGKVFDPAGKNPLYNVVVYVPNGPLDPLPQGATCDSCNSLYSGYPLVATTTNARGEFTLTDMPDGPDVPLVVQVGKWRRRITIPNVERCGTTSVPDGTARLPRNGSEGDIPQIAVSTGGADTLECLLRRVGLDASEYVGGAGGAGHIHIFTAPTRSVPIFGNVSSPNTSPPGPTSASALWSSSAEIMKYDMALLSCEGAETASMNQQVLFDYAAAGGRVFASHFHYAWFNSGPFGGKNVAAWKAGQNDLPDLSASVETKLSNGSPFPKGEALEEWLDVVGALASDGTLSLKDVKDNVDVNQSHTGTQAWLRAKTQAPGTTQYLTFNTPIGAKPEEQCGRVVFSALHVGADSGDYPGALTPSATRLVPDGCKTKDLSAQEKVLEFMLFDLSSCVTPDDRAPPPPPVGIE